MIISTSWVLPPTSIGGLDHLGTQAPCVLIYSQLLPGITNVTDRARYYSFYPWLLWSYDQRYSKEKDIFVEKFRRADCLFTLIAERHSRLTDHVQERHGLAMVGKNQLDKAVDRLMQNESIRLSEYTSANSQWRYFKNQLGGLGQYYAGTLSDLTLVHSSIKPWIKYTQEYGEPLAKKFALNVPTDKFWFLVEKDEISLEDLDSLSLFCPCNLRNSIDECQSLLDIFFDLSGRYQDEGSQRRKSLGLILNLTQSLVDLEDPLDLNESVFRAAIYSKGLPDGSPWIVPESLKDTLNCWSIYERNDLLSISFQTIFGLLLRALEPQEWNDRTYSSIEDFSADFCKSSEVREAISSLGVNTMDELVSLLKQSAPELVDCANKGHEIYLSNNMLKYWHQRQKTSLILTDALRILALLVSRDELNDQPYSSLAITPDVLIDYPINLFSFRIFVEKWKLLPLNEFLVQLSNWSMNTHMRVALRKLRQTSRSSFHIQHSEQGLHVVGDIPPPANTTPRFKQAVQIMRDIGVLERNPKTKQTVLSATGLGLLKDISV